MKKIKLSICSLLPITLFSTSLVACTDKPEPKPVEDIYNIELLSEPTHDVFVSAPSFVFEFKLSCNNKDIDTEKVSCELIGSDTSSENVQGAIKFFQNKDICYVYVVAQTKNGQQIIENEHLDFSLLFHVENKEVVLADDLVVKNLSLRAINNKNVVPSSFFDFQNNIFKGLKEGVTWEMVFEQCPEADTILIPASVMVVESDCLSSLTNYSDTKITNLEFEEGVSPLFLKDRAFKGLTSLKSIQLPNRLLSVGEEAFANCSSMTQLDLSSWGEEKFNKTSCLYNKDVFLRWPKTGTVIYQDKYKLDVYYSLVYSYLDDKEQISGLPEGWFKYDPIEEQVSDGFKYISLPSSQEGEEKIITGLEESTSIDSDIVIPEWATRIAPFAFYGNGVRQTKNIKVSTQEYSKLTKIYPYAFAINKIESVDFTNSQVLRCIDAGAFLGCVELRSVALPTIWNLDCLGDKCFKYCTNLQPFDRMLLSASYIGSECFMECQNLHCDSDHGIFAEWIGERAFYNIGTKSPFDHLSITKFTKYMGDEAFDSAKFSSLIISATDSDIPYIGSKIFNKSTVTSFSLKGDVQYIADGVASGSRLQTIECNEDSTDSLYITKGNVLLERPRMSFKKLIKAITRQFDINKLSNESSLVIQPYAWTGEIPSNVDLSQLNIIEIQSCGFADCQSMLPSGQRLNLTLPSSISYIGSNAFKNATMNQIDISKIPDATKIVFESDTFSSMDPTSGGAILISKTTDKEKFTELAKAAGLNLDNWTIAAQ